MRGRPFIIPWPTVPANNATVCLVTTHERTVSSVRYMPFKTEVGIAPLSFRDVGAVHITFFGHNKASAADGIKVYARKSDGTFTETDLNDGQNPPNATIGTAAPYQIPILATGRTTHLTLVVGHLAYGWAVDYVAGADNPETWDGCIALMPLSNVVTT